MTGSIRVFQYVEVLDAFLVTEKFTQLADALGLTEWHPAVWIGRLFMLDDDYGEHWFDNWEERDAREVQATELGIDSFNLMVINPERMAKKEDGPCNTPAIRKAFWTDVLKSLELSYDLLFQKARDHNVKREELKADYPEFYIEDLEARITSIEAGKSII